MSEFITIPEAVQITHKSDSSIRRLVKKLKKVNSPYIMQSSTAQGHNWLIDKDILNDNKMMRSILNNSEKNIINKTPSQNDQSKSSQSITKDKLKYHSPSQTPSQKFRKKSENDHISVLIETLREQLIVKDKQLAEKDSQLKEKDKHIRDFITRQGETNLLIHGLQVKLLEAGEDQKSQQAEEPLSVDTPVPERDIKIPNSESKKETRTHTAEEGDESDMTGTDTSTDRGQKPVENAKDQEKKSLRKGFLSWLLGE